MSSFLVVFECDDFVLIDKSFGVDFHDSEDGPGLFNQVKQTLNCPELYPVHRLDKVTSGLVVMAKTADSNREFCRLFAEREMEKYYLAIAAGKPTKKQGLVCGDMERGRRSTWKLLKSKQNPALTQFFSYALQPGIRLYLLKPRTGKTHQLRVALKSLAVPILGDKLYSGADSYTTCGVSERSERVYLHAYALRFALKGQAYEFVCLPRQGDLYGCAENLLAGLEAPWALPWPHIGSRSA